MLITFDQVRALLNVDEPDYAQLQTLGPEIMPYLLQLAADADALLASKATYLASLIDSDQAAAVVAEAARSPHATVRVAAAAAAANLSVEAASDVLAELLNDADSGVRKLTLRSAALKATPLLRARVQQMIDAEQEPFLRTMAQQTLDQMPE